MTVPVHAVVHARMSSRRLPGKVMRKAFGIPILGHLLERLGRCKGLDGVIVATSSDATDEMIEKYTKEHGVSCFRGDLDDVAARLLGASRQFGIRHIAR